MTDTFARSVDLHREHQGKLAVACKVPLASRDDLSLAATPTRSSACRGNLLHADEILPDPLDRAVPRRIVEAVATNVDDV